MNINNHLLLDTLEQMRELLSSPDIASRANEVFLTQAIKEFYSLIDEYAVAQCPDIDAPEDQEKIKEIKAEGVSGSNSVKITLDGEGEMQKIELSEEIIKEDKTIIEDLIVAAHNSAKSQLKTKTTEEISKATGGFGIPGFKWPL